ncbi:MucR family transcriptional regulator [Sinorhizobium meliloti]|uniref:MucR family transcriptional regulator n=1 Tax=Rhizobium meliloti TaxID=382 RepID=UPI000FD94391|nr:MucR family transcriptional regulator [Sinorhizobium meliloti]MCO6424768.1 MucR family transcriptional regulator [Sinorhizobium meliloti]MDW9802553.1 MucR family transcriptional regulator [Sinorhizobium meliloti]MDX0278123.1 MucR family transcriptional regulator [Sinorhizobium meliloti]MQU71011.1 MucR family transcriptional regulator [Sinorhizobium meliloti]RVL36054.1 MucR family transcriptional regulator [Sinorhizobium meliloti]
MTETRTNERRLELTSRIVSAYLSRNVIAPDELPYLIQQTYGSLNETSEPAETPPAVEEQRPAVPIKKSVTDDFIVCLEDGKKFKSLKRHLTTKYGMTPDQYREKWKLPSEYPMTARNYALQRSKLARSMGLGKSRASTPADA